MKTILSIDTTSNEIIKVGLKVENEEHILEHKLDRNKAQVLLPLIEKILKDNNLELKDLSEIPIDRHPREHPT